MARPRCDHPEAEETATAPQPGRFSLGEFTVTVRCVECRMILDHYTDRLMERDPLNDHPNY